MTLRKLYDDEQVELLARNLSELIILAQSGTDSWLRVARKLYGFGWRQVEQRRQLDPDEITRPADTDEPSDSSVLNDVIEFWQELEDGTSFPDALRQYYAELSDLITDNHTSRILNSKLIVEQAILNRWITELRRSSAE